MFFINPPFGNYLNLPYTTSIKGSYTLEPREGLFLHNGFSKNIKIFF